MKLPARVSAPLAIAGLAALLSGLLAAGIAALLPVKYQAVVVLSTVQSNRAQGLASQLLGAAANGSLQATPALVVRLTQLQSVLLPVAAARTKSGELLIEALSGKVAARLSTARTLKEMRRAVTSSYDRETGLVTLQVVHKDSALARQFVGLTVEHVRRVFVDASRAQGRQMRVAMEARVDSANSQLRHSEQRLSSFLSANRALAAYASAQAQRQQLDRDITLSQTIYQTVVTDREQAIAKELEDAPAVVVLDPLPPSLPTAPRGMAAYFVFGALLGGTLAGAWLFLSGGPAPARVE